MKIVCLSGTFSNGKTTLINDLKDHLGDRAVTSPSAASAVNTLMDFNLTNNSILILKELCNTRRQETMAYLTSLLRCQLYMWAGRVHSAMVSADMCGHEYVLCDRTMLDAAASALALADASDIKPDQMTLAVINDAFAEFFDLCKTYDVTVIPLMNHIPRPDPLEGKAFDGLSDVYKERFAFHLESGHDVLASSGLVSMLSIERIGKVEDRVTRVNRIIEMLPLL